jgi:hypothetical protein
MGDQHGTRAAYCVVDLNVVQGHIVFTWNKMRHGTSGWIKSLYSHSFDSIKGEWNIPLAFSILT